MQTKNKKNSSPPTLLIDGDLIAYKAASAANRNFSFDGDNQIALGSLEEAKTIVEDALASYLSGFKTKSYIIAFTDSTNWRTDVYPLYKANRQGKDRPVCLSPLKAHIIESHPTMLRPTLEADDILGILATSDKIIKDQSEKIIVSADKDMRSIPGLFYDIGSRELIEITEEEADRWHMCQTLTGDTSDGYPGCPGIGKVRAARILEEGSCYAEWWPAVVKAYERAKLTEADALTQARISRICRSVDYNYKEKKVILWTSPKS